MMRLKLSRISHVKRGNNNHLRPDALGAAMLFLHDLAKSSARKLASRLRDSLLCSISSLARIVCTMDKARRPESLSTIPWTAAGISALIGFGAVAAIIGWQTYRLA